MNPSSRFTISPISAPSSSSPSLPALVPQNPYLSPQTAPPCSQPTRTAASAYGADPPGTT
ncbi:hypothetical protein KSP39_PZI019265 [Platanthera zijinensis]|uniref:Uncharacterized protein n=1 Tax=Platanthera zijinensis TaxID=2320716 RepID=A0AAP0B229_9ASPA